MLPQNNPDRIRILFDDHRLVANAGLLLPANGLPQAGRSALCRRPFNGLPQVGQNWTALSLARSRGPSGPALYRTPLRP